MGAGHTVTVNLSVLGETSTAGEACLRRKSNGRVIEQSLENAVRHVNKRRGSGLGLSVVTA